MKKSILFALLGILFFIGLFIWKNHSPGIPTGEKAPKFSGKNHLEQEISLDKFNGKLVLIDFWASWCAPCKEEIPTLKKVYNRYKNSLFKNAIGLEIISISLDKNEDQWKKAIQLYNLFWESHLLDLDGSISSKYRVSSIPHVYLIDGNGKVIANGVDLRGEKLINQINSQLK